MSVTRPAVGSWYEDNLGHTFCIVAYDEQESSIDIQYYNGDIEDIDTETWSYLETRQISTPEDWTAPYDMNDQDQLDNNDLLVLPGHLDKRMFSIEIDD